VKAVIEATNRTDLSADCANPPSFGVVVRGQLQAGYYVGTTLQNANYNNCNQQVAQIDAVSNGTSTGALSSSNIPNLIDGKKHTFEVGVHGTTITLSIDGVSVLRKNDSQFASGGQTGVYTAGVRISVYRFDIRR